MGAKLCTKAKYKVRKKTRQIPLSGVVTGHTSFCVVLIWKQDLFCSPLRSAELANGRLKEFPLPHVMFWLQKGCQVNLIFPCVCVCARVYVCTCSYVQVHKFVQVRRSQKTTLVVTPWVLFTSPPPFETISVLKLSKWARMTDL